MEGPGRTLGEGIGRSCRIKIHDGNKPEEGMFLEFKDMDLDVKGAIMFMQLINLPERGEGKDHFRACRIFQRSALPCS